MLILYHGAQYNNQQDLMRSNHTSVTNFQQKNRGELTAANGELSYRGNWPAKRQDRSANIQPYWDCGSDLTEADGINLERRFLLTRICIYCPYTRISYNNDEC